MAITGILRYRGYPIEQLAEHCTFLEVAYLLLHRRAADRSTNWKTGCDEIMRHTMIHENVKKFMEGFHYDAHPMGMLISTVAALSTFYPEAQEHSRSGEAACSRSQRLIGKMPTIAAYGYRHRLGLPYVYPDTELSYPENFMNMLWRRTEPKYIANPVLARALDVLFILHADHEQNCSTNAMRAVGSSHADPYRHHGGGHRGALRPAARRRQRRSAEDAGRDRVAKRTSPAYIKQVKDGQVQADGLRAPGLQELRSARPHHQADGGARCSR